MKSSSICLYGFELHGCVKKEEEEGGENAIFSTLQFRRYLAITNKDSDLHQGHLPTAPFPLL